MSPFMVAQSEKEAKRNARARVLKKLRRAREKTAQVNMQAEDAQSQNTAAVSHNQATVPSVSKGQSQPVCKSRISKEEELKKTQAVQREKRAAAAERRISEAAAATGDAQGSSTTVGSTTSQSKVE
ncbi:hypothetical protein CRYUN_Cryun23aG0148000 [Craigia yunnanensis]